LQAGRTLAVDRGAANRDRKPGAEQRLARDVAAGRALLQRCAQHHVLDLLWIDLGAGYRLADRVAEQRCAFGGIQCAAIGLADRGTGGGNNHGVGHGRSPVASCYFFGGAVGAACDEGCCLRSSWRESLPTGVFGSSSTNSSAAGNSCLPTLPAKKARRSSSVKGTAPSRSLMKAFAASPR